MARALVRQQHGELAAYSDGPGMGAMFVFTLPLAEAVVGDVDGFTRATS